MLAISPYLNISRRAYSTNTSRGTVSLALVWTLNAAIGTQIIASSTRLTRRSTSTQLAGNNTLFAFAPTQVIFSNAASACIAIGAIHTWRHTTLAFVVI